MKNIAFIVVGLIIVITGCEKLVPQAPESNEVLAEPIADLTPAQLALHS